MSLFFFFECIAMEMHVAGYVEQRAVHKFVIAIVWHLAGRKTDRKTDRQTVSQSLRGQLVGE